MTNINFDKAYVTLHWPIYELCHCALKRIYHRFIINVNKLYLNGCDVNKQNAEKINHINITLMVCVLNGWVCCPKMRRIAKFSQDFQLADRYDYGVE